jgi:hypothetical protein
MVEPVRHRQTKEAGTDMFEPKATAPHLVSTATKIDLADQALGLLCLGFFVGMSRWLVGLEKDPEIIGLVYRTRP